MIQENNVILTYLKSRGYEVKTNYYSYISEWVAWYRNYVQNFHMYHDQDGTTRYLYRMAMAKKGSEDWSSILYTERDEIVCGNSTNEEYIQDQFKKKKLNQVIARNIEKAMATGTLGTTIRLNNIIVKDNQISGDEKSSYDVINVTADSIVPLLIENGKIINVAFCDTAVVKGKNTYYIQIHERQEDNTYKITNVYLDSNGVEVPNDKVIAELYTHSEIPLFTLLMPNIENNIADNNGLGISIYANAIDQLKGLDIAYNNYVKDTILGGKKVFYNKSLLKYRDIKVTNSKGESEIKQIPIYPDDITKQQFQVLGDEFANSSENTLIQEYNPSLRVNENEENINYALMMYAFMLGMGKYYRFENGSVVTATQYLGENKDLVNSAKKHRVNVNDYVAGIIRSILLVGRLVFGENLDENDEINLVDKDGFLVSDEELRQQWLNDFNAGLMSKKEYIMKVRGVSEEEALKIIQEISDENPTTEDLMKE